MPQIQHDERNPNDCANEPHELTHICDALRYFCVGRVEESKPKSVVKEVFNFSFEEPPSEDWGYEVEVI